MKNFVFRLFLIIVFCVSNIYADILTDNFDNGISSSLWSSSFSGGLEEPIWSVVEMENNGDGFVSISKSADNDFATEKNDLNAGLKSTFLIDGDFSVTVDFDLFDFPYSSPEGWNEANLLVRNEVTDSHFQVLRFTSLTRQYVEGFSYIEPYNIGAQYDSTTTGKFKITRNGHTMSAWFDRGKGFVLLGSRTSSQFLGSMSVNLLASQIAPGDNINYRPNTSISVGYDNLLITADTIIIPEPASLLLFGIGGLILRKRNISIFREDSR